MTDLQFTLFMAWFGYLAWAATMCKFTLTEILAALEKANNDK